MIRGKYQKVGRLFAFLSAFILLTALIISFAVVGNRPPLTWNHTVTPEATNDTNTITLLHTATGETETLDLDTYLIGVVAAEVSPTFEEEALKAQAIVARTFTLRRLNNQAANSTDRGHETNLCDDYGHCQAYRGEIDNQERWGEDYDDYMARCRKAVESTHNMVVTYDGELAATFYHSTCGGKTASAEEVWGQAYPYLVSVDCNWDQDAPRYDDEVTLSLASLPDLLGDGTTPCINLPEGETATIVPVTTGVTGSGRIDTVTYSDLAIPATEFRRKTGINSTLFWFYNEGDTLTIYTHGYGHGVGLCQHGANGMAKEGYTCGQILTHFYPGTTVEILHE